MSKKETKEENIELVLGTQLGSDQRYIGKGNVQIDRMTVLEDDIDTFCIAFSELVPREHGGDWLRGFFGKMKNLNVSKAGRGRRDATNVATGSTGAVIAESLMRKPGWFSRNVRDRDWEKEAESEGKHVID